MPGSVVLLRLAASYLLPVKLAAPASEELTEYLLGLSELLEVVVADGSTPEVFEAHHRAWGERVHHIPVKSVSLNGKVAGVVAGLAVGAYDRVVIADDDVRYGERELRQIVFELESAEAVVPQNYFAPLPWHARWDTGRTLVNRALHHDYAGTVAIRRSALPRAEYCGDVLFENLELLRTVAAAGGHVRYDRGLYVRRRPPSAQHFCRQRVRQAYDSFAQPARLAAELALLPALSVGARSQRGRRTLAAAAAATVAAAEFGRRRAGGARIFASTAALWAPIWAVERAVCSWLAVVERLRGGVRYAGRRLRTAAHSERDLVRNTGCLSLGCACSPERSER